MKDRFLSFAYRSGFFSSIIIGAGFGAVWFNGYLYLVTKVGLDGGEFPWYWIFQLLALPFWVGIGTQAFASRFGACYADGTVYRWFCSEEALFGLMLFSSVLFWATLFFFIYRHWLKKQRSKDTI